MEVRRQQLATAARRGVYKALILEYNSNKAKRGEEGRSL